MSKAIAALIAGGFALAATGAMALELDLKKLNDPAKQAELDKIISSYNANAPARGEAIKKSAVGSTEPMALADTTAHERMLERAISSGNANAPARGRAIADSMHATPRAA